MLRRKPIEVPEDPDALVAFTNGATIAEWSEFRRTNIITLSMNVKWWWRRTWRVLR